MARAQGGTTRTEGVYRRMRADILGGRLKPGQRLKFPELFERYQSSVGATREVLTKLAAEGLVKAQPHIGYTVTPLSHEALTELTQARVEIESVVLRLSILGGDTQWEAQAIAAHHVLERTPMLDSEFPDQLSQAWTEAHANFHHALLTGCRNRRLVDMARGLREEAELYRQWSVSIGHEPDRDLAGEHRAILDATLVRDADLATERLRDHIAHTTQLLISSRSLTS